MPQQNQEVRLPAVVNDRLLVVPDYQRPYAWSTKQLDDLWEDLDLLGRVNRPGARPHYAGTLVLRDVPSAEGEGAVTSQDDDGNVLTHCEVVDGQQRLTTCFLLLDRVRRRLEVLAADGVEGAAGVARGLRSRYGFVSVGNAPVPRLRLGAEMNPYWTDVVLGEQVHVGPPLLAGQQRLDEAKDLFDKKIDAIVAGVDGDVQLERLKDLQGRVTHGLGLLVYEVESLADVGVIFETVNERGRSLTDLEKTKNYLLYLVRTIQDGRADQLAEKINVAWAYIFRNLAREASGMDDQLLRAHWLVTQSPVLRDWKRMASLKARFDRSQYVSGETRIVPPSRPAADQEAAWDRLAEEVSSYVETLRQCSFFLDDMFSSEEGFEAFTPVDRAVVRRRSGALRRSGIVALYRPLLFAARLAHPADGAFYADLVQACETYSARVFVIEQRRQNAGEVRLLRLAHELFLGTRTPEQTLDGVYTVLRRYADEDQVRATLTRLDADWYHRRGHKYFLYEYERGLLAHPDLLQPLQHFTDQAQEQRTTEHVLPQKPYDDERGDCWRHAFSPEEHKALVHSLGNLVLTYDNSSYSNKCFAAKRGAPALAGEQPRRCYAQAELLQERELAHVEDWTPAALEARQQRLAQWALARWHVPAPTGEVAEMEDDDIEPEGSAQDQVEVADGVL